MKVYIANFEKRKIYILANQSPLKNLNMTLIEFIIDRTWCYRTAPPVPPKFDRGVASALGGIMWWWVLWHLWTEPEHITVIYQTQYLMIY